MFSASQSLEFRKCMIRFLANAHTQGSLVRLVVKNPPAGRKMQGVGLRAWVGKIPAGGVAATLVFLPRIRDRGACDYSPQGCRELNATEVTTFAAHS